MIWLLLLIPVAIVWFFFWACAQVDKDMEGY